MHSNTVFQVIMKSKVIKINESCSEYPLCKWQDYIVFLGFYKYSDGLLEARVGYNVYF